MDTRWTYYFGKACLLAHPETRLTGVSPSGAEAPRADRIARLALVKLATLDRSDYVARSVDQIKKHEELARKHDAVLHRHDVLVA